MKKKIAILFSVLLISLMSLCACDFSQGGTSSADSLTNSAEFFNTTAAGQSVGVNVVQLVDQEESTDDLKTVLAKISQSVVEVYSAYENGTGAGSGVVIGNAGTVDQPISYIATCHHVIDGATAVNIKTNTGETYTANLIGSDPDTDLCIMSVAKTLPVVSIARVDSQLQLGENVVAIGNPLGTLGGTVTRGIISSTSRDIEIEGTTMTLLQTDAAINSGNSGGGLFTESGVLVGIVNAKYSGSSSNNIEGLGFAIPYNILLDISQKLITTQTDTTPGYIEGKYILGYTVNNYYTTYWGAQGYVFISELDQMGSFYKSGLRVYDRIDSVTVGTDTFTVTNATSFAEYINAIDFKIGDKLTFSIIRDGKSKTVEVTIMQYVYGAW